MSPKRMIAVAALIIAVVLLAVLPRKSVRVELTINASPDEIWTVLTDAASYPEWNPIFVSVQGSFDEGAHLAVQMQSPDGGVTLVEPVVKKLVVGQELNQTGGITGVLTFDHTWKLDAVPDGTRVTQYEEYRGIGVLFWDPGWVEDAYQLANENLRDRVESR